MSPQLALIREIDAKMDRISAQQRGFMLRHLTDLFLVNEDQYTEDEIELIDDLFVRLVETIEESARALLGIRLAPVAGAPPRVLRLLAHDDAFEVASAVLSQSEALDDETLVACAKTKSLDHLAAISQRKSLSKNLTDVLVDRGDRQVLLNLVRNICAQFSEGGFGVLVRRARGDDELGGCVGARSDLPRELFERLVGEASEVVRAKFKAERQFSSNDVDRALSVVATKLRGLSDDTGPQGMAVQSEVQALPDIGELDNAKISELAEAGSLERLVISLALMANRPVEIVTILLQGSKIETIIVLAKAIGLSWEATWAVALSTMPDRSFAAVDIEKARAIHRRLLQSTARQILDFYCRRGEGLVH